MRLNSLLHHFNVAALRPRAAANSAAVFPLDRHSRTRLAHVALVVVSMRDDYVAFAVNGRRWSPNGYGGIVELHMALRFFPLNRLCGHGVEHPRSERR